MSHYESKLLKLWNKYKMSILYLVFGVCTTAINIIVYYYCAYIFTLSTVISTCIAWILSVCFAYITNKKWVFESKTLTWRGIIGEFCTFLTCRLLTGGLDLLIMFFCVDVFTLNDLLIKIFSNVIVLIVNYIVSKGVVFRVNKKY